MNYEQLEILVKALGVLVGLVITFVVKPYIDSKVSKDKQAQLKEYIEIGVRCAEQIFSAEEAKKKKDYVLSYCSNKIAELGTKVSAEELDVLIEAMVNQIKYGMEYTK